MSPKAKRLLGIVRALFGLALLAWVLGREDTWQSLRDLLTTTWLLPALTAFTLVGGLIESVRLGLLFRSQRMVLSFWNGVRVVLLGAFFNFSIPGGTGGDVMKLYYLAQGNRGRRVEVATILMVDRIVAVTSLLLVLFVLGAIELEFVLSQRLIGTLVAIGVGLVLAIALGFTCAFSTRLIGTVKKLVGRLPLGPYAVRVLEALHAFRGAKSALAASIAVSVFGHTMLLGIFASAGAVLFEDAPATRICLLALLGLFANALPLTPGGLGVGEAVFDKLFRLAGYTGGSPLILAWRAAQIPFFLIGGGLYVFGPKGERPFAEHEDETP